MPRTPNNLNPNPNLTDHVGRNLKRLSRALSSLSRTSRRGFVGVRIRVLSNKRASQDGPANPHPQAVHSLEMGLLNSVGRPK